MNNKLKHKKEIEIFLAIKIDEKGYYYSVPCEIRRSAKYRISDKKYNKLKKIYEDSKNKLHE